MIEHECTDDHQVYFWLEPNNKEHIYNNLRATDALLIITSLSPKPTSQVNIPYLK